MPPETTWPDPPRTVFEFLCRKFPRIPADTWRRRFEDGKVIDVSHHPLNLGTAYRPYLRVGYFREIEAERPIPFEERILSRTERLLVVDKPPFLPTAPVGRFVNECLIYRLEKKLGLRGLAPLHRLDRMTSGVILLSADPDTRAAYSNLFAERRIEKCYEALGHAPERPERRSWTVRTLIREGEPWFRRVSEPSSTPNSHTEVELTAWQDGVARFTLRPVTGKTHQLRVHLAGLGFPILGDPFYPVLTPEGPDDFDAPMALIARQLSFEDPISRKSVRFSSRWTWESLGFTAPD